MNRIQLFAVIIVCIGTAALYFSHENESRHAIKHADSQQNEKIITTAQVSAEEYIDE